MVALSSGAASAQVTPSLAAQGTECRAPEADEAPLPLCMDGNGLSALRTPVRLDGSDATVAFALRGIAAAARVKITFEVDLLALHGAARIPAGTYTVAAALLRAVDQKPLAIYVMPDGDLRVRELAAGVSLAPIRTVATAESRQAFEVQPSMGSLHLSARDLSAAPTLFEPDVFRTIQLLPGIETRNDYSAGLNVRGGESDQNLILLDGYPIYNPFHLGGLLGTFIDPMVGKVDLLTGAQPARYGERLSSVLDVQSAEESRHGLHGSADVSLLAATASVGSAFDGGGSWMLGGRHTYADVIANIVKPNSLPYHFQDVQGHASRPVFGGALLSVTAYDGDDASSLKANNSGTFISWGNRVLGATLSKLLAGRRTLLRIFAVDSVALAQRASITTFDASAVLQSRDFALRSTVRDIRASGTVTLFAGTLDHSIGYEVAGQHLFYSMNAPLTVITNFLPAATFDQSPTAVSGWYDALWHLTPALMADGGVRFDAVRGTGWSGLSPRFSLKYFLTNDLAIVAATGSYAQWLHSLGQENSPVQPLQFWISSSNTLAIPVSRAWQSSLGVEAWPAPERQYRVEAFYKKYSNLLETNPVADPTITADQFMSVAGTSYGADVLVRQLDTGRFSGWISYSYAVSDRVTAAGAQFNPGQDRRHQLNAVGSWRLDRYRVSIRFGLATGTPYTPILGEFTRERYDPAGNGYAPDFGDGDTQYLPGATNSARYPINQRLDVNVTRIASGTGRVQVSPFLSIANVYGAPNPAMYIYNYGGSPPTRYSFPNLPFLPTVGVHIAY
jgi:hypothetical protein